MDGSADGLPLLSQDEFFRHLNLQSVYASSAKYHYRQALKERLRASKVAINGLNGLSVGSAENKNNTSPASTTSLNRGIIPLLNGDTEQDEILISPSISPCSKWFSPNTCRLLFGRPRIKVVKRVLNFNEEPNPSLDEVVASSKDKNMDSTRNFSILHPLMQNYHVLRHPGIKKELEERAAAEGRLLSDELSNKIKEELPVTNNQSGANNEKRAQCSELTLAEENETNTNHTSVGTFDSTTLPPGGSIDKMENVTNENCNALAACTTTSFSPHNTNNSCIVPKGSIQQRKCYIPITKSNSSEGNSDSKEENDKFHVKYFRTQPGRKCAAKLDQEERVRKLATLALFGHTFPHPDIARVRPHAVAVNGFKRHHIKVLSKLNNGVDSDSSLSYSSLRATSKKNRKSKFPRICLSGKTASELLARSPACTESSSSEADDEDDDCGNNNTQLQPKKIQLNSKELKRIKTLKSKSLLGSLPKLKNKKSDTGEKEDEKEEDEFACHYCDRTFTTKSGLGWHESYSHPRTCRICAKSFQFSNRWTRHKDPICNACSEKFPQPKGSPIKVSASLSHYNPQQLTEKQKLYYRFKCDICSKLFGKRDRMIKHITNNHPSDMHKVDLAKFVFSPKKATVGGNCYGGGYSGTATKCTPAGIMEQ